MTSTSAFRGPSLAPLSGNAPRHIILLLHGYGSNGADLIALAPHWRPHLPDALFIAPDAPERCRNLHAGYQWWDLTDFSRPALAAGASGAAPALDAFIDDRLDEHNLGEKDLVLVGFSQGTMMALQVGLRRERQVAGILGYSGMLTGANSLAKTLRSKPPVLLVHGSADPIVPVAALHEAKAELEKHGLEVAAHVSPGLGHSVDPTGLRLGAEFVEKVLNA